MKKGKVLKCFLFFCLFWKISECEENDKSSSLSLPFLDTVHFIKQHLRSKQQSKNTKRSGSGRNPEAIRRRSLLLSPLKKKTRSNRSKEKRKLQNIPPPPNNEETSFSKTKQSNRVLEGKGKGTTWPPPPPTIECDGCNCTHVDESYNGKGKGKGRMRGRRFLNTNDNNNNNNMMISTTENYYYFFAENCTNTTNTTNTTTNECKDFTNQDFSSNDYVGWIESGITDLPCWRRIQSMDQVGDGVAFLSKEEGDWYILGLETQDSSSTKNEE